MVWTGYEVDESKAVNVIIEGRRYDLSKWQAFHPGGHFILHQYVIVVYRSHFGDRPSFSDDDTCLLRRIPF